MEELLDQISSRELSEWMVHLATHTSDDWIRTASLIQATVAPHCKRVPSIASLVPRLAYRDVEEPMSIEQMKANLLTALS